jgi:hypothetical protein
MKINSSLSVTQFSIAYIRLSMKKTKIHCSGCGAPYDGVGHLCDYCHCALAYEDGTLVLPAKEIKDFGWSGAAPVLLNFAGALAIYFFGWYQVSTDYVRDNSLVTWSALMPAWIILCSVLWKTKSKITFLLGLPFALVMFGLHLFLYSYKLHRYLNDDAYAITGGFAGGIFLAWIIGRLIHMGIRKRMND